MQLFWQIVVWLCIGALVYTYVGYPVLMCMMAKLRENRRRRIRRKLSPPKPDCHDWPVVSFLIPAFNEQQVIRQKVENTLELDYPKERLKIVVVSDGSNDQTNAMLASYGKREIEFLPLPKRSGKTIVLNQVIPQLTGDIVVLSDASGMLKRDALKKLIRHFRNPKVGCVSGVYMFEADDESLRGLTEKVYWSYETFLKKHESRVRSAIGAHGALYGFRRHLFKRLRENTINDDFILPMQIIRQGYRVFYEPQAIVLEQASTNLKGEFNRRIRINVGNFQQIYMLRTLLNPKRGLVALQFLSHKVLRTISPFFILMLPLACLLAEAPIYSFLLKLQIGFYLVGLFGYLQEYLGFRIRYLYLPFYFLMGNVSAVFGFVRFVMHKQSILWKRV
jgi:cellulose synthase/poly-beta-1,6-N-acetylglucosamine synthase-like glycosyltransferase